MLSIYTSLSDVTKNDMFINDIDAFFGNNTLVNDDFTKLVLTRIEKAKDYRDDTFVDKYGITLYSGNLSTGAKILLSIKYYPNYIFNAIELGYNAAELLSYIESGKVYIANRDFQLEVCDRDEKIQVDNNIYDNIQDVNDVIGG